MQEGATEIDILLNWPREGRRFKVLGRIPEEVASSMRQVCLEAVMVVTS